MAAVLLWTAILTATAQERLWEGTVTDRQTGEPLSYATCRLLNSQNTLAAYCTTDGDGRFALAADDDAAAIEFSLLGYQTLRMETARMGRHTHIQLVPTAIRLKEVEVRVKPIERDRDTLNYNVAAFQGPEDRYIEDILKKLPGIHVSEEGTISYNGKPINQFHIEGMNLLGGRYNHATRNLPADAVARIQVVENDQHVKALKEVRPSDRATINIRLKSSYRSRLMGEVAGSIGRGRHTLWNNRLTTANIGHRQQWMATARMADDGHTLGEEQEEHLDAEDLENYEPTPGALLRDDAVDELPIARQRHADNRSWAASASHLLKTGTQSSLRIGIDWLSEHLHMTDSTQTVYGGTTSLALSEHQQGRQRLHRLAPSAAFELNTDHAYIQEELKGNLGSSHSDQWLISNGQGVAQTLNRHPDYLQNKTRATLNRHNHIYELSSLTVGYDSREQLRVDNGMAGSYRLQRLMTRNSLSTTLLLQGNELELKYCMDMAADRTQADGSTLHTTTLLHTFAPTYTLRYRDGYIGLSCPVSTGSKTFVAPTLNWSHRFSPLWRGSADAAWGQSYSRDFALPVTIQQDYRSYRTTLQRRAWTGD